MVSRINSGAKLTSTSLKQLFSHKCLFSFFLVNISTTDSYPSLHNITRAIFERFSQRKEFRINCTHENKRFKKCRDKIPEANEPSYICFHASNIIFNEERNTIAKTHRRNDAKHLFAQKFAVSFPKQGDVRSDFRFYNRLRLRIDELQMRNDIRSNVSIILSNYASKPTLESPQVLAPSFRITKSLKFMNFASTNTEARV